MGPSTLSPVILHPIPISRRLGCIRKVKEEKELFVGRGVLGVLPLSSCQRGWILSL